MRYLFIHHIGASGARNYAGAELALRSSAPLRSGPGGRASVSGVVATVFGASGFIGRYIGQSLGGIGSQVVFPYRCDDTSVQHLRTMGDLGQVVMLPDFSIRDEAAILRAVSRSNVVVNCLGADQQTWNYGFDEVHVGFAQALARAIKAAPSVERVLHVSALGAAPDAPSARLRSKFAGEEVLRRELGERLTVFRPAPITGPEDRLFNSFARLARALPVVPLAGGGAARMQPVWVRDVAQAVFNSLAVSGSGGKTVAVAGPREYTVRELLSAVHEVMREKDVSVPVPDAVARLAARCADALAAKTPFRLDPMFSGSSVDELLGNARRTLAEAQAAEPGMWTAQDLEVEPLDVLEGHAIEYLRHYRIGGYSYGSHLAGGQGAVYRPPEAPGY